MTNKTTIEEKIKKALKLKVSLKYNKSIINLKDTPEELAKSQKIADMMSELLFNPVFALLKQQRQEILEKIKNNEICLNCGRDKKSDLSGWCSECFENE